MGRETSYTPEIAAEICDRLSTGETLRQICRSAGMPSDASVRRWAMDDVNGFASQYASARDLGLEAMADDLFDITDDGSNDWMERELKNGLVIEVPNTELVMRSRLRADTRKWYLSKLAPKRYGDRLQVDNTSSDGSMSPGGMTEAHVLAKLNALHDAALKRPDPVTTEIIKVDDQFDASDIA